MAIVLSGYGSRYIDCRRTVYTHHLHHHHHRLHVYTTAISNKHTTTTNAHPPLFNHRHHHPRKHEVLLLFGRVPPRYSLKCCIICDYNIVRVERNFLAFSGYVQPTCRLCSIAPDKPCCMEYCARCFGPYRCVGNEIGRRFQRRTTAVSRNAAAYEYSNQFSTISNGAVLQF